LEKILQKNDRLKIFRESLNLSQKAFSEKYFAEQRNISKYETGLSTIPDELELQLAKDGLNLHWLATGEGDMLLKSRAFYEIPLLTVQEVKSFDPEKEIPEPKAHTGDYPERVYINVPDRIREFGTDLRAIRVVKGMSPIYSAGDMVIFEATGWVGDGEYVCIANAGGDIGIGHVQFKDGIYILKIETEPDNLFFSSLNKSQLIGRVRTVLKEV
jgi:transcriptional regulator with XRE-family HTH domain